MLRWPFWRSRPLLLPVVKLLLLLLFVSLLNWRSGFSQRVRPLLRRRPFRLLRRVELAGRLSAPVFRWHAPLRLRGALLLIRSRLRPRLAVSTVWRSKGAESIRRLLLLAGPLIARHRPSRRFLPHQGRLIETSARLRLPLIERARHGSRCSQCDH